jgi:hypothetical protein
VVGGAMAGCSRSPRSSCVPRRHDVSGRCPGAASSE